MAAKLFNRYNRINQPIILFVFIVSGLVCYLWIDNILISNFDDSLAEQAVKINRFVKQYHRFPKNEVSQDWKFTIEKTDVLIPQEFQTINRYDNADRVIAKYRQLSYSFRDGSTNYLIVVTKSLEALDGLSRSIALTTTITLLGVVLASLVLSRYLLKKLWQPFYDALALLNNFRLGKKTRIAFTVSKTEEFDLMNESVQALINSAEKDYLVLKEFTENASHEMQTPVAIIRSKLDIVMQSDNLLPDQSQAIKSAYAAVRRLSNLTRALLLLAKIENHQFTETAAINLEQKMHEMVEQLAEFWVDKNLKISLDVKSSEIRANPTLIDLWLTNILSNASRHNTTGGIINIKLDAQSLVISNTGSTIPLDPDLIFSRFYKQEQNSVSNGLGLAIIKQICDHSGILLNYYYVGNLHTFSFSWPAISNLKDD